jgi:hypothetical protein
MAAHRHSFVRATRHGVDPDGPYRVCTKCRAVQRKVSGRWVQGAQAANPTEAKNVARRVLGDKEES